MYHTYATIMNGVDADSIEFMAALDLIYLLPPMIPFFSKQYESIPDNILHKHVPDHFTRTEPPPIETNKSTTRNGGV